jgi:hypothetical protein
MFADTCRDGLRQRVSAVQFAGATMHGRLVRRGRAVQLWCLARQRRRRQVARSTRGRPSPFQTAVAAECGGARPQSWHGAASVRRVPRPAFAGAAPTAPPARSARATRLDPAYPPGPRTCPRARRPPTAPAIGAFRLLRPGSSRGRRVARAARRAQGQREAHPPDRRRAAERRSPPGSRPAWSTEPTQGRPSGPARREEGSGRRRMGLHQPRRRLLLRSRHTPSAVAAPCRAAGVEFPPP